MAILKYIETLTLQMEAPDFVNSSETRLAVSRIITWTIEPKSSDVRKVPALTPIVTLSLSAAELMRLRTRLVYHKSGSTAFCFSLPEKF